ncbi:MAG: phosphatidate cytidylyltransferase [Bacteroidales bacterium]|nr:phosphatidate cytidylyltransferase [Bacteroidales bacterium]
MKNFITRAITGLLFVVIMVGGILYNPLSFGFLFALISMLTVFEFGQLVNQSGEVYISKVLTSIGAAYLFLAFMAYSMNVEGVRIFTPYLAFLLFILIKELYQKRENPIGNWAYSMLSQLYIALPFATLNLLGFQGNAEDGSIAYNPIFPLSIFIFLWLSDTGAYCFGSLLGKHRLFERISPKKSWEGCIGGGIVSLASAFALAYFFPFMTYAEWAGLALTVVVFGTWGDLVESLMKRQLGVKDSGNFLPGHGGLLDRFDSSLIAIPAAVIYLYCIVF